MQVCIHAHGVKLTEAIRRFASEKLVQSLERLSDRVQQIQLHLVDSNGPNRSGLDKSCRVVVKIHKQKSLVLEETDSSVGMAIHRISDRLRAAVSRRIERRKEKRRGPNRKNFDRTEDQSLDGPLDL